MTIPMRELKPFIQELCSFATGVVTSENRVFFERLQQELPFKLWRYPSGSSFNGWVVPQMWKVQKAEIKKNGKVIFDGTSHTLGVASYSKSFSGILDWQSLKPHLVTMKQLPSAYVFHSMWQYRPWDADWAFSIPYRQYKKLGPGKYQVELITHYQKGEMIVAENTHLGRSKKTIVFNAHTCHPHQANDGMAGVAILIRLFQWIRKQSTYYTYRLVLCPEHIGTVFYLKDYSLPKLRQLVSGVFAEMPGTKGPLRVASTFLGNQMIDRVFRNVVRHHSQDYTIVPWRQGAGNDETVWEAPGYEVPFVEITRCEDTFAPYREYHTSLDTPDLMIPEKLQEFFEVLQRSIYVLEHNATIHRKFDGLLCLSNPDYDLYMERPDPAVKKSLSQDSEKWGYLLDSLLRYFDGSMTILDIAEKHQLSFDLLYDYLLKFQKKNLIEFRSVAIQRLHISHSHHSKAK